MSLLLKIVQGPNAGAEIALVEGVAVTLGKADTCDIVLADLTLPDEPMKIEAAGGGVTLDGEALEPFGVVVRGSTAFAVGPADAPWGELKWPAKEEPKEEVEPEAAKKEPGDSPKASRATSKEPEPEPRKEKRRGGCGCLVAILLVLLVLAALCWVFREQVLPYAEQAKERIAVMANGSGESKPAGTPAAARAAETIEEVVSRHGIAVSRRGGRDVLVGDFATRAERLSATAEAYAAKPGVELDFADGESLRSAVADTLSLVGEPDLSVSAVTSRVAVLVGGVRNLRRTLEAISADVPKLANVDVSGVTIRQAVAPDLAPASAAPSSAAAPAVRPASGEGVVARSASLPVCGILTTPYPCLVLKNGSRVLEGAPIGEWTIVKVEEDSVTVTNSTGRFVWKP